MRVTLLQADLRWEDPVANRAALEERLWDLHGPTDLIVLPEMFTTGFTMNAAALAEPMNLTTFRWLRQVASQHRAAVTGSYIVCEGDRFFNRMVWMEPDGQHNYYDKRHCFRMAREHETYTPGARRVVRTWRGWRVLLQVCYDLRFPVWSRNVDLEYDLVVYVANWPAPRRRAWNALLPARAVENLSYAVGVNRVGTDGGGVTYAGDSAAYDAKGETLLHLGDAPALETVALDLPALQRLREKFPAHLDADRFRLL